MPRSKPATLPGMPEEPDTFDLGVRQCQVSTDELESWEIGASVLVEVEAVVVSVGDTDQRDAIRHKAGIKVTKVKKAKVTAPPPAPAEEPA